ncbi:MAG: FAD-binding domain-containing protein, partial [Acidimicrobiales bacterium]|nr:FAD-binding domain-containing protein [Acidimicrobiales bacterium]
REFYADVLFVRPESAWRNLNPRMDAMPLDTDAAAHRRFDRWATGTTGFPFVDAGMRQLAATGWMHNRVRMVVASFLVKDLHLPWQWGARHFMAHLVDGDLASNSHGWQWAAGTGTDAAPYFRVFNPTSQGERFDPDGDYVRRWVPELAAVAGRLVHAPGLHRPEAYPPPMVDHGAEREEALRRYRHVTAGSR